MPGKILDTAKLQVFSNGPIYEIWIASSAYQLKLDLKTIHPHLGTDDQNAALESGCDAYAQARADLETECRDVADSREVFVEIYLDQCQNPHSGINIAPTKECIEEIINWPCQIDLTIVDASSLCTE